ncbi:leucine-rich repeat domain-containing protein [Metamycoplasma hominis]|uniref:leucine-rich repeat domain-containing protein n=1 Tax=Metamycoplasma hominis TaxID=2098 RepID=UPI003A5C794C
MWIKTTKVTIPSSIKEIDKSTFSGCKNLKEVILNDGLERIDYGTFQDTNIESITIPGSRKEIYDMRLMVAKTLKK